MDWAYVVCARPVNDLCGNPLYDWLSGGFNYQINHRLLLGIAREHRPLISGILRATGRVFSYPFKEYNSLDFLSDHYACLAALGAPAKPAASEPLRS